MVEFREFIGSTWYELNETSFLFLTLKRSVHAFDTDYYNQSGPR